MVLGAASMWILMMEPVSAGVGCLLLGALAVAVVIERQAPSTGSRVEVTQLVRTGTVRALIVGAGAVGRTLAESLEAEGKCLVVGFVDDEPGLDGGRWPVLGTRADAAEIVRAHHVDEVILAYAPTWQQKLADELMTGHPGLRVRVVPSAYEALMRTGSVESLGDIALVRLIQRGSRVRDVVKRVFDVMFALVGLMVLAPVCFLAVLLVKLSSPGPAIFSQERVGLGGRRFTLYKLRTMVQDAEANTGPVLSSGDEDSRLTKIGAWLRKCRMDEVPQLWNVLRGDMSLVGPRPERPHFVDDFERRIPSYGLRHRVRPGMTGLAQVYGGYHTDARDKLRFDLIYVSHQSLWLDVCILARTLGVVVRPR
jgi:exopolysaccharide biosynthesis polyprenyl glycosylphosphotransferase